jgi:hypothetical protein
VRLKNFVGEKQNRSASLVLRGAVFTEYNENFRLVYYSDNTVDGFDFFLDGGGQCHLE